LPDVGERYSAKPRGVAMLAETGTAPTFVSVRAPGLIR
jgi:hypothetical protein